MNVLQGRERAVINPQRHFDHPLLLCFSANGKPHYDSRTECSLWLKGRKLPAASDSHFFPKPSEDVQVLLCLPDDGLGGVDGPGEVS